MLFVFEKIIQLRNYLSFLERENHWFYNDTSSILGKHFLIRLTVSQSTRLIIRLNILCEIRGLKLKIIFSYFWK